MNTHKIMNGLKIAAIGLPMFFYSCKPLPNAVIKENVPELDSNAVWLNPNGIISIGKPHKTSDGQTAITSAIYASDWNKDGTLDKIEYRIERDSTAINISPKDVQKVYYGLWEQYLRK